MATTPGITEDLAANAAGIYANAEHALITKLAEYTAKGLAQPEWMTNELATTQKFRAVAQGIAADAKAAVMDQVTDAGTVALQYGYQSAATELGDKLHEALPGKSTHAVAALAAQMSQVTDQATFAITSTAHKAVHDVVLSAAQAPLLGVESPADAAQRALNRFAEQGITSVSYAGGRQMRIEHYVEMAMRTGLMNAAIEGHTLKLKRDGVDLVQVSDHAQECETCRPYEGKVLTLAGRAGALELPSAIDGATVKVQVTATLADARARGLFHPNCRHTYRAFIAGAMAPKSEADTADPKGNALRVRQRALERTLRDARRREAAAITPQAKASAKALVKTRRDRLTAHIDANDLKRLPARERITGQFGSGDAAGLKPGTFAPKAPRPATRPDAPKARPAVTPDVPAADPAPKPAPVKRKPNRPTPLPNRPLKGSPEARDRLARKAKDKMKRSATLETVDVFAESINASRDVRLNGLLPDYIEDGKFFNIPPGPTLDALTARRDDLENAAAPWRRPGHTPTLDERKALMAALKRRRMID